MDQKIVIAGACRTPVGRFGGNLKDVPPQELLRLCFNSTLQRANLNLLNVDEVIAGCCINYPDSMNIARVAILLAGLSEEAVNSYKSFGKLTPEKGWLIPRTGRSILLMKRAYSIF